MVKEKNGNGVILIRREERVVRLIIFGEPCQIDTLVLTPRAAFIIEVKNLQGELTFDENTGQFTQTTVKRGKQSIGNPLLQVERHQLQFEKWLHFQKVFSYPIIPLVAISNPSTILNFPKGNPHQWKISHSIKTRSSLSFVFFFLSIWGMVL